MINTENDEFVVLNKQHELIGVMSLKELENFYLNDQFFREEVDGGSLNIYTKDSKKSFLGMLEFKRSIEDVINKYHKMIRG